MQSVYTQAAYDIPQYTPLVPQHIIVNSPQVQSSYRGRYASQQDYRQYIDDYSVVGLGNGVNGGAQPADYAEYEYQQQQHQHQQHQQHQHQQQQIPPQFSKRYPDESSHIQGLTDSLGSSEDLYRNPQYSNSGNFQINDSLNGSAGNLAYDYPSNGGTPSQNAAPNLSGGTDFNSAPSRTVYLGNVPVDITPKELLDHVRSGVVENVRILPEKMCAFISFLDESSALLFHSDAILKRLTIKDNDIKVGWGRNVPMSSTVMASIQRDGATRNVYIGNLPKDVTEDQLIIDLGEYGLIDTIKILEDKGVAFVHFCSILSAVKVVNGLSETNEFYSDKKIFYGKDRCAFITKTQQHNAAQYLGLAPGMEHLVTNADREFISSTLLQQSAAAAAIATTAGGANNLGNRTVYLGNLPKEVKVEEICNVVRGGLLQNIKYLQDRHVCFITFIDPIAAAQFFAMSQLHGLTIHAKRIKIGWGKHSGPLTNALTLAVSSGASRNIYIGNIDLNNEKYSKENLRERFLEYGDIEQINYLVEKNCVFVNFTNISNAILAIDKIKIDEDFKNLKINYGKDRCGNIPRQFVNTNTKQQN